MKRPDLLKTTAMRMAMRYSLIYALMLSVIYAAFLWGTKSSAGKEVEEALLKERDVLVSIYHQNGMADLLALLEKKQSQSNTFLYLLTNSQGNRLAGQLRHYPEDFDLPTVASVQVSNYHFTEEALPYPSIGIENDEAYLPTLSYAFKDKNVLLIAHSSPQAGLLMDITESMLEFTVAIFLLLFLFGLTLGHTILRRINIISDTAAKIMQGDITQRIPLSSKNDEFDGLSGQLNQMMDRIQKLIDSIREVSDNVAHDLRSPLTRLRNNFEVTLLNKRSNHEYREALTQGVQDVESLITTFNALLSIAQAESGNHRSQWKKVKLHTLLTDVIELYEPLAKNKQQQLKFEPHDEISMTASRHLLGQAFSNLIENAIKYTPRYGVINITLKQDIDIISITFTDSGQGIPIDEHAHVLERFVRLDNSRQTEGNGLGLSLVNAVCKLHQGRLQFADASPGLIVHLQFPLNSPRQTLKL